MREILFRGKMINNGEWFYGVPFISESRKFAEMKQMYSYECQVDPETIGQYTGLTDKNGTKIFEGDIVIGDIPELIKSQNLIGVVEYEGSAFIVRIPNRKKWQIQKVGFCSFTNYRVIGNVFDNPELLEKVEE